MCCYLERVFNFGYCCSVQLGVGMWNVKEFLKIYKVVTRYCVDLSADILNLLAEAKFFLFSGTR